MIEKDLKDGIRKYNTSKGSVTINEPEMWQYVQYQDGLKKLGDEPDFSDVYKVNLDFMLSCGGEEAVCKKLTKAQFLTIMTDMSESFEKK